MKLKHARRKTPVYKKKLTYQRMVIQIPHGVSPTELRAEIDALCDRLQREVKLPAEQRAILESDEALARRHHNHPVVRANVYGTDASVHRSQELIGYNGARIFPVNDMRRPVYMRGCVGVIKQKQPSYWADVLERYLRTIKYTCLTETQHNNFFQRLQLDRRRTFFLPKEGEYLFGGPWLKVTFDQRGECDRCHYKTRNCRCERYQIWLDGDTYRLSGTAIYSMLEMAGLLNQFDDLEAGRVDLRGRWPKPVKKHELPEGAPA